MICGWVVAGSILVQYVARRPPDAPRRGTDWSAICGGLDNGSGMRRGLPRRRGSPRRPLSMLDSCNLLFWPEVQFACDRSDPPLRKNRGNSKGRETILESDGTTL
jgi:hypothetical protein